MPSALSGRRRPPPATAAAGAATASRSNALLRSARAIGVAPAALAELVHEMRTPLAAVIGTAERLLQTQLGTDQERFVETIRTSCKAALAMASDLLDYTSIEAGRIDLAAAPLDVRDVVEEATTLLAGQAHAKNLELSCHIARDVPALVVGDAGRLRQVLVNLIANAIKFTDHGEISVRAMQSSDPRGRAELRFEVADTGPGVPRSARARVFRPFARVPMPGARREGAGLGLAICRRLVERMGGRIDVEDAPGRGSIFWFTVRMRRLRPRLDQSRPELAPLAGSRVLVVEESVNQRMILRDYLAARGMLVDVAADGPAALELLRLSVRTGRGYDLVTLDMLMPGMDGLELAHIIKNTPALASVPLVMVTAYAEPGHAAEARAAGIVRRLPKPVREADLIDAVCTAVGLSAGSQPGRALVAEDDVVLQRLLREQLAQLGWRADAVASGRAAVRTAARRAYDVIFVDRRMPVMDGIGAIRAIRGCESDLERVPGAWIVAMSAGDLADDAARCRAAGADAYLTKPVRLGAVRAMLASAADRMSRARRARRLPAGARGGGARDCAAMAESDRAGEADGLDAGMVDCAETARLLLASARRHLLAARAASLAQDTERLGFAAHSLRGTALTLGARRLAELAGALETLPPKARLTRARALVRSLSQELERVAGQLDGAPSAAPRER